MLQTRTWSWHSDRAASEEETLGASRAHCPPEGRGGGAGVGESGHVQGDKGTLESSTPSTSPGITPPSALGQPERGTPEVHV